MTRRVFDMGRGVYANSVALKPFSLDALREAADAVAKLPPALTGIEVAAEVRDQLRAQAEQGQGQAFGIEIRACPWMPKNRAWLAYSDGSGAIANLDTGEVVKVPPIEAQPFWWTP